MDALKVSLLAIPAEYRDGLLDVDEDDNVLAMNFIYAISKSDEDADARNSWEEAFANYLMNDMTLLTEVQTDLYNTWLGDYESNQRISQEYPLMGGTIGITSLL